MSGKLPSSASVAHPDKGAKLFAPSAERNAAPIAALLAEIAPDNGRALEIASGTGQHIVAFANACPALTWHPTEIAPDRIASVDAYVAEAGLENVALCRHLDASAVGWSTDDRFDLVVLCNLLHLIPETAAATILSEASQTLTPNGIFVIYGPFSRDGDLTSDGDVRFDSELRAADPMIGYKDDSWMAAQLAEIGLNLSRREMPANNLAFIARRD